MPLSRAKEKDIVFMGAVVMLAKNRRTSNLARRLPARAISPEPNGSRRYSSRRREGPQSPKATSFGAKWKPQAIV